MNHLGRAGGACRRTGAYPGRTLVTRFFGGTWILPRALRHCSRPGPVRLDRRLAETLITTSTRSHERPLEAALDLSYDRTRIPTGRSRRLEGPGRGTQEFRGRALGAQSPTPRSKALVADPAEVFGAASTRTPVLTSLLRTKTVRLVNPSEATEGRREKSSPVEGTAIDSAGHRWVRCLRSRNQTIVRGVRPDPEPDKLGAFLHSKRPIMQADAHRPERTHLLEVQ